MRLMDCVTILSGYIKAKVDIASGVEFQGTQEVEMEDVLNEETND